MGAPDRAGFIDLNRTRLRLWEWGDVDAPPVICAHGAYDHGRMWDGLAPRIAQLGYRVVAPDIRGHGDSGPLSSGHVFSTATLDLALLARELGPPVGAIGHSFGGGLALWAAAIWPELLRWVVNLDGLGPPTSVFDEADLAEMATRGLDAGDRLRSRPRRVYPTLADMGARRSQVNVRLPAEWIEHLVAHGATEAEGGYVWKADPTFGVGLPAAFQIEHLHAEHALVECPVLVLSGAEDDTWSEMTPAELDDRLSHLSTARHDVIEGAGHYVHIEQPDAVMTAIESFLDEVGW